MKSILLSYSQPMHGNMLHSYHYDYDKKVNVIRGKDGVVLPFVESKLDELYLLAELI